MRTVMNLIYLLDHFYTHDLAMKKRCKAIIFLSFCCLMITGCANAQPSEEDKLYISFTLTYEEEDQYQIQNYYFDLNDERVVLQHEIPYTSKYSLTVFDKARNQVFYTRAKEDSKADNLVGYHLDTQKEYVLSDTFYAINDLFPYKDRMFIAGAPLGQISVNPFYYDFVTESIEKIEWDADYHISQVYYRPLEDLLYVSCYSMSDDFKRIQNQDVELYTPSPSYLYQINGTESKRIGEIKGSIQELLQNKSSENTSQMDMTSLKELLKHNHDFEEIIYQTKDQKFLYYISDKSIKKYDVAAGKSSVIFCSDKEISKINNAVILEK